MTIVYRSAFVPPEWIAAFGLDPLRLTPHTGSRQGAGALFGAGVCPFMRAFVSQAPGVPDARAIVMSTTCDQMRRGAEIAAAESDLPLFLLNMPATCSAATRQYYRDELVRLGRFLETVGGEWPDDGRLAATMRGYERSGAAIPGAASPSGVPIAVIGGPLLKEDDALFGLVERAGGQVVLNGLDGGERTMPRPFDPQRLDADPLGELVDAYFGAIPDAFRRPDGALHEWLREEVAERGARGVILVRYVWCDIWHGEAVRMKEQLPVPVLDLDLDDEAPAVRYATRIEAFMEMLA